MARRKRSESTDERVRRQVGRRIANTVLVAGSLLVIGAWAWFGTYQLDPGQAAVILRFGRYVRTVRTPGLKWHLPPPIESHRIVNVAGIEREEFGRGLRQGEKASKRDLLEAAMQTSDNNIVHVSFVVQYRIKSAFDATYHVADPRAILRDAAQAAVREVVGRTTVDGVLSEKRGEVEDEAQKILQQTLDRYQSGLAIVGVQLQEVQPPPEVRDAFNDVIAAAQDRNRAVNEAQGHANEVIPKARAKAIELKEQAQAYAATRVDRAKGEAARFDALVVQYRKAPEVTRNRLYLETMEQVLPKVKTVVVDPEAAVLPYLPLPDGSLRTPRAPAPRSGGAAGKAGGKAR